MSFCPADGNIGWICKYVCMWKPVPYWNFVFVTFAIGVRSNITPIASGLQSKLVVS